MPGTNPDIIKGENQEKANQLLREIIEVHRQLTEALLAWINDKNKFEASVAQLPDAEKWEQIRQYRLEGIGKILADKVITLSERKRRLIAEHDLLTTGRINGLMASEEVKPGDIFI